MSIDDAAKTEHDAIHLYGRTRTSQDFVWKGGEIDMGGFAGNGSYRSYVSLSVIHNKHFPLELSVLHSCSVTTSNATQPPVAIFSLLPNLFPADSSSLLRAESIFHTTQRLGQHRTSSQRCPTNMWNTPMKDNCFLGSVAGNFQTNIWSLTS